MRGLRKSESREAPVGSDSEVGADLSEERRFPAVNFELLGIERRVRNRGVDGLFVCGDVFGPELEFFARASVVGQAVDGEAQVRQDIVLDDIVEENGIRVEDVLRQDDAIVVYRVLADELLPRVLLMSGNPRASERELL